MSLAAAIKHLYPGIVLGPNEDGVECAIFSAYGVEEIVRWERPEPMPTQAELDAAILPATKADKKSNINVEATRRILAAYPLEKQSSANLGIYPQAYTDQMIADIASVISASNAACDAVDAAVDVAGADAVTVNWPVIGV